MPKKQRKSKKTDETPEWNPPVTAKPLDPSLNDPVNSVYPHEREEGWKARATELQAANEELRLVNDMLRAKVEFFKARLYNTKAKLTLLTMELDHE
jgi:hypothetical protein